MITEHGSLMNTCLISNVSKKLVSGQIGIFFCKPHVVPGDVLGLENITGLHIRIGKSHRWEMIAEEHDDGVLSAAVNRCDQISDEVIHFMNHVDIIFPLVVGSLICGAGNKNIRIFQNLLGRVIAVTFHGNGIYEIGLVFCRVHSFYSLLYQHIIGRPVAIRRVLGDVHALLAGKGIESHHGKSIVAAVESSGIVMYDMRTITDLGEIIGNTFAVRLF